MHFILWFSRLVNKSEVSLVLEPEYTANFRSSSPSKLGNLLLTYVELLDLAYIVFSGFIVLPEHKAYMDQLEMTINGKLRRPGYETKVVKTEFTDYLPISGAAKLAFD